MFISNSTPLYTSTSQPYTGLLFLNPVGSDSSVNGVIILEFLDGFIVDGYTNIPYTAEGFSLNPGDYCAMWLYGNPEILINTPFVCESIIQLTVASLSIQEVFNTTTNPETYSLSEYIEENRSLRCCVDSLTELKERAEQDLLDCKSENQELLDLTSILETENDNLNNQIEDLNNQIEDIESGVIEENNIQKIKEVILEAKNNPQGKYKKESYNNSNLDNIRKLRKDVFDLVSFGDVKPNKKTKTLESPNLEDLFGCLPQDVIESLIELENNGLLKVKLQEKIKDIVNEKQYNQKTKIDKQNDMSYNKSNSIFSEQKNLMKRIKNNG